MMRLWMFAFAAMSTPPSRFVDKERLGWVDEPLRKERFLLSYPQTAPLLTRAAPCRGCRHERQRDPQRFARLPAGRTRRSGVTAATAVRCSRRRCPRTSPWSFRDSGTSATPLRIACLMEFLRTRRPFTCTSPEVTRSLPNTAFNVSLRPLPIRPTRPRISPRRTFNVMSEIAEVVSLSALSTTGAPSATGRGERARASTCRPTMSCTRLSES